MTDQNQRGGVTVLITGGTIDSEWNPSRDTAVTRKESILPEYFSKLNLDINFTFKTVCMKDSRELTPDDLAKIAEAVEDSKDDKILITHGTYTMPDTARYLQAHVKSQKYIALTGSVVPLDGYTLSDAPFNLGFAVASLMTLEPGIVLCVQGQLFRPEEVAKNMAEARFFSVVD